MSAKNPDPLEDFFKTIAGGMFIVATGLMTLFLSVSAAILHYVGVF